MMVNDSYHRPVAIANAVRYDRHVEIVWDDSETSRFHHVWLRDNCQCKTCHDEFSHQKMVWLSAIPRDIAPVDIGFDSEGLTIVWNQDRHPSRYRAGWLRANCYSERGRAERRFRPALWTAATIEGRAEMDYCEATATEEGELRMLETVRDYGFILLRNVPVDPAETEKIGRLFGYPTETNWGIVFDIWAEPEAINIANTGQPIAPHTDDSFRYASPGIELFHCLEATQNEGGLSLLVDGFQLGTSMREEEPEAFRLVSQFACPQFALDRATELRSRGKVFTLHDDGIVGVRYCECTQAPLDLPEHLIEPYYDALRVLAGMVQRDDLVFRFRLRPGDTLVFDNQRVLHGRTAYDGAGVRRHLRNTMMHRDGFHSRLRILGMKLGRPDVNRVLPLGAGW